MIEASVGPDRYEDRSCACGARLSVPVWELKYDGFPYATIRDVPTHLEPVSSETCEWNKLIPIE